ncbi:MAG: hypothetical protein R3E50_03030 [Halioglobus sp.]
MARDKILALFGIICSLHIHNAQAGVIKLAPVSTGAILYDRTDYIVPPGYPYPPPPPVIHYRHEVPINTLSLLWADSAGCLCAFQYLANGYVIYDVGLVSSPVLSALPLARGRPSIQQPL